MKNPKIVIKCESGYVHLYENGVELEDVNYICLIAEAFKEGIIGTLDYTMLEKEDDGRYKLDDKGEPVLTRTHHEIEVL